MPSSQDCCTANCANKANETSPESSFSFSCHCTRFVLTLQQLQAIHWNHLAKDHLRTPDERPQLACCCLSLFLLVSPLFWLQHQKRHCQRQILYPAFFASAPRAASVFLAWGLFLFFGSSGSEVEAASPGICAQKENRRRPSLGRVGPHKVSNRRFLSNFSKFFKQLDMQYVTH